MNNEKILIAGIQQYCNNSREENLEHGMELLNRAANRGATIICFPELFSTPWFPQQEKQDVSKYLDHEGSETVGLLKEKAKERNVTIIAPVYERGTDKGYNSAFVLDADGNMTGKYRKVHVPDMPSYHEKYYFKPGDLGFPVFDLGELKIGIQICWDVFFPEGARILALKGAHVIICPTASAFRSQPRWIHTICAHSIANNCYMIRVNRVGMENEQEFYGESFAVNPFGEFILEPVGKTDAIALVEVDINLVNRAREGFGFFSNRRPELYGLLSEDQQNQEI
jgi:N-carbamoylputrescine amidase